MSVPSVVINKSDGNTGVAALANPVGILAVIAPCEKGSAATPVQVTKPATALSTFGYGLLSSIAAYGIPITKKPMVLVRASATTPGALGAFVYTGTGTLSSFITQTPATAPLADFSVVVQFIAGGTTGTTGITYRYSTDARAVSDPAKNWSAVQSLGTGLVVAIPNTGISMTFVTAKTVVAGDSFTVPATGPRLTTSDVTTAMNALKLSNLPWEAVLIAGHDATSTTVSNSDSSLAALELNGRFRGFIASAVPRSAAQTESQYLTAMTAAFGSAASIRGCVGADAEYVTDPVYGFDVVWPKGISFACRLLSLDVTVDAARNESPLQGVRIVDALGNPVFHDEVNDPGLDDQRLVVNRSWANKAGVYINNPRVISSPGSDYVFAQHWRTMNRACELAFGALVDEMSKGVFKDLATLKIREDEAVRIENAVNNPILAELGRKVAYVKFTLSRDDDLGSNAGVTLSGTVEIVMPTYIKGFAVNAKFSRGVTVTT